MDAATAARIEGNIQSIDAIDQRVEELRARVEARSEAVRQEYAELIEQRKRTARVVIVWRAVTLVFAVAAAVSFSAVLL